VTNSLNLFLLVVLVGIQDRRRMLSMNVGRTVKFVPHSVFCTNEDSGEDDATPLNVHAIHLLSF
jgi:hypothetical protein